MKKILQQRWEKILAGVFASILVFTLIGFFIIPVFIKSMLVKKLSANVQREVLIHRVKFNPYLLSLIVDNLVIKDEDGEIFASLDELFVNLQFSSVFQKALIIKGLHIKQPYIRVVRNGETSFNFSDLIPEKGNNAAPIRFSLHEIKVIDGKVDFWDEVKEVKHTLNNLNVIIPFLSNLPRHVNGEVILNCSALLNDTPIFLTGKSRPFSDTQQVFLQIDIQKLDIPQYSSYLPLSTKVNILSGYMNVKTALSYSQKNGSVSSRELVFSQAFVSLDSLTLKHKEEKEEFVIIPKFSINNTKVDVTDREITIEEIFTENGSLLLKRFANGTFNFQDIVPPVKQPEQPEQSEQPKRPWLLTVREFLVREFTIQGEDLMSSSPVLVTLDQVNLHGSGLTTKSGEKGLASLSLRWNKTGTVSVEGSIGVDPIIAEGKISAANVDISPLHSYVTDAVNLAIAKANVHADGDITFGYGEESSPTMSYRGDISLSDFVSIEKLYKHTFLQWKIFSLLNARIKYNPTEIYIDEVFLDDFSVNLLVHSDGTPDFHVILVQETKKEESLSMDQEKEIPPVYKKFMPPVTIDTINLQNGKIDFIDRYINPGFKSKLEDIKATISGFSSEDTKPAHISLTGRLKGVYPLEITGKIDPFPEKKYADINVVLRGFDLPFLTPYVGRYIGYTIEKGKLYLNLGYTISGNELYGENRIILDRFTLGDKLDSQEAISLPIKSAINFLKDRKGEIRLDFPVKGNIDDPKFKLGKVVLDGMVNLIKKVVTSPLALLGNIFGSGKKLAFLEFDYGSDRIGREDIKKLKDLITALYERPFLRLEIRGGTDQKGDRNALKLRRFTDLLKVQKLKDRAKKGKPAVPLSEVEIYAGEYETYLRKAYKAADFPKSRNVFGFVENIPVQKMEKLLMDHIVITDGDLRLLADRRAIQVKDYILKSKKVEPERIFIVESKIYSRRDDKKGKRSRVQFALR
ncbi:MAG: DUF748 domain-containing protein [Candidatus Jettenia sp.]|uniref:AsmA domain-containing protein n=1 Tax=Candidatus Jettenia caeni TaxID=247490 RepID=I3IP47_9BACT|nr:DUF748 domain-containing protein [Candidatus Jettenia sp. AMX1]MBC6930473.1 DUF748 domain-containing protein [Candidatus Jettenia sp.]MDL1940181.1 DUF748 domain-containing protein [Candidatus Jettenia sp. AMX1]GAB63492.1 conserved hypothetical protein [Candidatus Jettenia caeni]GJQ45157.1 MAG: hypothetical protein JETCAE04_09110 [Candidatus Jettenia caeni]